MIKKTKSDFMILLIKNKNYIYFVWLFNFFQNMESVGMPF